MAKYVAMRVPKTAYDHLVAKQLKMEETIKRLLGKNKRIPLTKVLTLVSKSSLILPDKYVIGLIKKRK